MSASAGDEEPKSDSQGPVPDWVQSSTNFTRGTEALDARRYDEAVSYLEKAVALDPSLSRNQNNLAAAYFEVGRVRDGWPHVREAVNLDPTNPSAKQNFLRYFAAMMKLTNLQEGDSYETVRTKLGPPDQVSEQTERVWWRYGHTALEFKAGHLSGAADMGVSK
jgi:tetratricopeptide (TPR) repeat protein